MRKKSHSFEEIEFKNCSCPFVIYRNFFRGWEEYKYGFGNLTGEYWIGNENLYFLTNQGHYK